MTALYLREVLANVSDDAEIWFNAKGLGDSADILHMATEVKEQTVFALTDKDNDAHFLVIHGYRIGQ